MLAHISPLVQNSEVLWLAYIGFRKFEMAWQAMCCECSACQAEPPFWGIFGYCGSNQWPTQNRKILEFRDFRGIPKTQWPTSLCIFLPGMMGPCLCFSRQEQLADRDPRIRRWIFLGWKVGHEHVMLMSPIDISTWNDMNLYLQVVYITDIQYPTLVDAGIPTFWWLMTSPYSSHLVDIYRPYT